ncbi:hypothetical protein LEN26_014642 [Aphanomyces euteiches]|nr:hypothetical protein AeMF1_020444 [Aphanomyces euteiches]KAH9106110.1 hypothetical protein LEN26_014642 [Aphanomyces euteiches]KAH9195053.1 hypothetical protein AeNC1_002977 [Aphanomyces euteiches]
MLGRFFNGKKEEPKASRPPHAVGASTSAARPGPPEEPNGGGGFFNLPPPVAVSSTQGVSYNHSPAKAQSIGHAPQPPIAYGGASNLGFQRPTATSGPPSAAPSLFGGMSLKQSAVEPPPPVSNEVKPPSLFGGLELGGSSAVTSVASSGSTNPSPMSLSALNLPQSTSIPPTLAPEPVVKRPSRSSSGFNYLDVAPPEPSAVAPPTAPPVVVPSGVKKKKKPTFRPGFGRQLSEESVAALQRGDLKDADVVADETVRDSSEGVASVPLAKSASIESRPASGGSSILKGLKVHVPDSSDSKSTRTATAASGSEDLNSLLANMTIRSFSSNTTTTIPSLVKVASQRSSPRSNSVVATTSSPRRKASPRSSLPPSFASSPAPTTPEERLAALVRDFDIAAGSFRASMGQLKGEESHIMERKLILTKQIAQFNMDLHEVEAQQIQSAEDEDFEKADALNATIEKIRHCLMLSQSDLRKCEQDVSNVAKQKEKLVLQHVRSAKSTLNAVTKFEEERTTAYTDLAQEAKSFKQTERRRFAFEQQRVATELHHVTVNMDHLDGEKAEIEASIASQCSDEYETRTRLLEEKSTVEAEIAELEAKLAACRAQVVEIDAGIAVADEGIQVVRNKFSRQLKRLAEREKSILKTRKEIEADEQAMHRQEAEFEAKKADFSARLKELATQVLAAQTELRVANIVCRVAEDQNTRRQQKEDRLKKHETQLCSVRDEVQEAEKDWKLLKNQQRDLEKKRDGFRTVIMTAGTTLPQLEAEKKQAAADRNFKEAARLSKEIKQLEKDRSSADEQIEVIGMEIKDLDDRIAAREEDFNAKKSAYNEVEKTLELETLNALYETHHDLRVVMRQLTKYESPKLNGAVDFRTVALALVQSEYDSVVADIEVLEDKYELEPYVKELAPEVAEKPLAMLEEDESDDGDEVAASGAEESNHVNQQVKELTSSAPAASPTLATSTSETKAVVELTPEALAAKIASVEHEIEKATEEEDYELAAQLDEELETWKQRLAQVQEEVAKGPSEADLRAELEALQHAIESLADQIEHATEEEEYEIAAHLDEELIAAQTRKTEIQLLLAQNESAVPMEVGQFEDEEDVHDNIADAHASEDEEEQGDEENDAAPRKDDDDEENEQEDEVDGADDEEEAPKQVLFAGLEPKSASSEQPAAEASVPAPSSLFGGLSLASHAKQDESDDEEEEEEEEEEREEPKPVSLFAGLEPKSAGHNEQPPVEGVPATTSLFGGLSLAPIATAINDATDHAESTEEEPKPKSLFAGLEPKPVPSTGHDGSTVEGAPAVGSSSLFGGLALNTTATVVAKDEGDDEEEEEEDEEEDDNDAEESHEVIEPLEENHEDFVEEDDKEGDVEAKSDEFVQVSSSSLFGGLSLASTEVSAPLSAANDSSIAPTSTGSLFGGLSLSDSVSTTEDAAPSSGGSLFGGLSFQPQPIVPVDASIEGPRSPKVLSPTSTLFGGLSVSGPAVVTSGEPLSASKSDSIFGGLAVAPPLSHPEGRGDGSVVNGGHVATAATASQAIDDEKDDDDHED